MRLPQSLDLPEQMPITKRNTPVTGGAPTTPGQAYHSETHSKITKILWQGSNTGIL